MSPERPKRRRPRRLLYGGLLGLAVVIAIAGGTWAWVLGQVHSSPGGAPVTVVVAKGETLSSLAPILAQDKVVSSSLVFKAYLHTHGGPPIQAGTYVLARHEPYSQILSTLAKGPALVRLVIPEGYSLAQIAARVGQIPGHSATAFLVESKSGQVSSPFEPQGSNDLEGLLFPATYTFVPSTSDQAILQMMVTAFDQQAASINLDSASAKIGYTPYQVVTMASIVLKEVSSPADLGKAARVFYNRLAQGIKLQTDPTVIYALGGDPSALAGVTNLADVATTSPYNTYVMKGLPPTPIDSPGIAALDAALNPTPGNWLYFEGFPDGTTAFCQSYSCQLANEAKAAAG